VTGSLVRSTLDRAVRVGARHLTLTVLLTTQLYKWVPAMDMVNVLMCVRQFRAIVLSLNCLAFPLVCIVRTVVTGVVWAQTHPNLFKPQSLRLQ